jgi:NagD protein
MPKSYLIDLDGVIVRGSELIPGADAFLDRLRQRNIKFLILTNNPLYTQRDLQHRLQRIGVNVTGDHIYTSALATAQFLKRQMPAGTAFVIGESGLTQALHEAGYVLTDHNPDCGGGRDDRAELRALDASRASGQPGRAFHRDES